MIKKEREKRKLQDELMMLAEWIINQIVYNDNEFFSVRIGNNIMKMIIYNDNDDDDENVLMVMSFEMIILFQNKYIFMRKIVPENIFSGHFLSCWVIQVFVRRCYFELTLSKIIIEKLNSK